MTRKDYIAIAAAIRAAQTRINDNANWAKDRSEQLRGVRRVAAHLADELSADNPKGFDAALFLINCGYGGSNPGVLKDSREMPKVDEPRRRFPGGAQSGSTPN